MVDANDLTKLSFGLFANEVAAARKYDSEVRSRGLEGVRACNFEAATTLVPLAPGALPPVSSVLLKDKASACVGVTWLTRFGVWDASITESSTKRSLGHFSDELEASRAYEVALAARISKGGRGNFTQTSKYVGVYALTKGSSSKWKWCAKIKVNGSSIQLGYFNDEKQAARAYDEAAAPLNRKLNFSTSRYPGITRVVMSASSTSSSSSSSSSSMASASASASSVKEMGQGKGKKRQRSSSVEEGATVKWHVQLLLDKKTNRTSDLGYYSTEEEAVTVYKVAKRTNIAKLAVEKMIKNPSTETFEIRRERKSKSKRGSKSCYTGVSWWETETKWIAQIRSGGARIIIGRFANELDAARAYDAAAVKFAAEHPDAPTSSRINFPGEHPSWKGIGRGSSKVFSAFVGVSWSARFNKWRASLTVGKKQLPLGYWTDEEDAALVYDAVLDEGDYILFMLSYD